MINLIVFLFIGLMLTFPLQNPFGQREDLGTIDYDELQEISGMAASRINPNIFWVHNDSGNDSKLFAIDRTGRLRAEFDLQGIKLFDAEDIAVGPGPDKDKSYVYLADIGDNGASREKKYIFRFPEPDFLETDSVFKGNITSIDVLTFDFPDGKRDAETIMIDPIDRDIVIVSKREENVHVYSSPVPGNGNSTLIFNKIAVLPYGNEGYNNSGVTGGDISTDGKEVLIKTYSKVYYYRRETNDALADVLSQSPIPIDYVFEPQGEAICFGAENEGFYTTSEISPFKIVPHLYFYPRLSSGIKDGGFNINQGKNKELRINNADIYDINGVKISGINSKDNLNSGLYFLKYTFDDTAFIRKMLIVK
jgi:hypothetical protein